MLMVTRLLFCLGHYTKISKLRVTVCSISDGFHWVTSHERRGVSNHRQFDCLFSKFFGQNHITSLTSRHGSAFRITGPLWEESCKRNPSVTQTGSPHKGTVTRNAFPWHHVMTLHIDTWVCYQIRKIAGCACAGSAGNISPATAG